MIADNLRLNQTCFNLCKEILAITGTFSCKYPVENEKFETLYLLCDASHLLKDIRNSWQTEKMQKLKFTDLITNKEVNSKGSDLIPIYKIKNDSLCKLTN